MLKQMEIILMIALLQPLLVQQFLGLKFSKHIIEYNFFFFFRVFSKNSSNSLKTIYVGNGTITESSLNLYSVLIIGQGSFKEI